MLPTACGKQYKCTVLLLPKPIATCSAKMQNNAFKVMALWLPVFDNKKGKFTFRFRSAETTLQPLQELNTEFQILKECDTLYATKDSRQWLMFKPLPHELGSTFHFYVKEMFCLYQSSFTRQVIIKCNAILYYKVIKIKQGKDKSKCTNQNLFMLFGDTVDLSVTLEEFYGNIIKLQNQITFFSHYI